MIVTLMDGTTLRTTIRNCTGYVAKRIELEARDCDSLLSMLEHDPAGLRSRLKQLGHRFPERRAPYQEDVVARGTLTGRTCGKRPELAMGYGMSPPKWVADQQRDVYRAMFPEIANEWTHIREPAAPKQEWSLLRWFLFWFTLFFLAI